MILNHFLKISKTSESERVFLKWMNDRLRPRTYENVLQVLDTPEPAKDLLQFLNTTSQNNRNINIST